MLDKKEQCANPVPPEWNLGIILNTGAFQCTLYTTALSAFQIYSTIVT